MLKITEPYTLYFNVRDDIHNHNVSPVTCREPIPGRGGLIYIYLGSIIDKQRGTDMDEGARIGKARAAFITLKNIWNSKVTGTQTKL